MTDTAVPAAPAAPTSLTSMSAEQITEGLRSNQITGFQRRDAVDRLASLLTSETPVVAPSRVSITQIPTAADSGVVVASNPGQAYRDAAAIEQGMRAALDGDNAARGEAKFGAIATAAYAPAKDPGDYTVPISHMAGPEDLAADSTVREALHAAQLPTITANTITAALDHTAMSLEHADGAQLQAFGDREAAGLRQLWGDTFTAKVQAVDAFLDSAADRIPYIAAVLANPRTRYFLADRRVVNALSQMIEGRAPGAARK